MLTLDVSMISECGGRDRNEDACGHWQSDTTLFCVLADGAGGHGGGQLASRLVVEHLLGALASGAPADGDGLERLVRSASQAVAAARRQGTDSADMHATVVALAVDFVARRASWVHAGDSRLYRFRDRRMIERTRDHSTVQALVDAGMLPESQLREHPRRSELRSALGVAESALEVAHSGAPREVQPGDMFLLCSDGLWEHVPEPVLESTLDDAQTPDHWLQRLEHEVRERTLQRLRWDNFTALAVWAGDGRAALHR